MVPTAANDMGVPEGQQTDGALEALGRSGDELIVVATFRSTRHIIIWLLGLVSTGFKLTQQSAV